MIAIPLDGAILESEKGMVAANPHVAAGMEARAPLADQDRPGEYEFAAETLDAQPLGMAVTAVLGGALSFFVCHGKESVLDGFDADDGKLLPVAVLAAVSLAALLLEYGHLLAAFVFKDFGLY